MATIRKRLSAVILLALMLCGMISLPLSATAEAIDPGLRTFIDSLFEQNDHTLYSMEGDDVTQAFYQNCKPAYQSGDYAFVWEYYYSNVAKSTQPDIVSEKTSGLVLFSSWKQIEVIKRGTQTVDEELHGLPRHNIVAYTVTCGYTWDQIEDKIIYASNPVVDAYLSMQYGGEPGRFSFESRSATVASNRLSATYSFYMRVDLGVREVDGHIPVVVDYRYHFGDTFVVTL